MWQTISGGRVWHGTVCNRRKDGSLYWVESTIVPFLDENGLPYQYVSVRTDVTELMQIEARLRAERDFSEAAINAIPGTFYVLGADGRLLRANESTSRITGYGMDEISRMDALDFFAETDRVLIADAIHRGFEDGHVEVKASLLTKAGARIPFYFQAARFEFNGVPTLIGTGTDISALKRSERELIRAKEEAERAKEEAERASRAKSEFLSSMSHELRTPMNAILGFAQLLEMDAGLPAGHRQSAVEILKAGRHLLGLINDVLDLAKIESGRIDLVPEPVACDELFAECGRLVESMARERGVALHIEGRPATVLADRMRLKQAVLNLLSNAIKYNRPQGEVRLEATVHEAGVRISVTDTGPGISPERQAQLFQAFNRLGAECTEVEGTGIGLVITRRLVERMGGSIGVEGTPGVGSTFWVELPRAEAAPSPAVDEAVSHVAGPTAESVVLYVEDNPANLRLVEQLLARRPGIRLLAAHTPSLGLDLAAACRPDLVLLDINLPGMDGHEVLRRLRALPDAGQVPVIAVTANAMPRDVERSLAAGFSDYLTKPLDISRFFEAMDRLLASRAQS